MVLVSPLLKDQRKYLRGTVSLMSFGDYGSAESHRSAEITHWVKPSVLSFLQKLRPFSKKVKTFLDFSRNVPCQGEETKSVNRSLGFLSILGTEMQLGITYLIQPALLRLRER